MTDRLLRGGKGGSSSSPTQAPDTLSSVTYAQILDLICEGPIQGPPSGVAAQSVYLNNVPLQNADGSNNFVTDGFDFRYGDVNQTYIPGFASSQQETNVNVELKNVTPWTVVITDLTTDEVWITLEVQALSSTDPNSGDVNGYEVDYQILLSVDGGAASAVVSTSFNGKCTSAYQRTHKIPVSGAKSQYQLQVVRTTADTTSVYIADTTMVVSYTQVIDAKLTYPYSVLSALSVDAVQFSSIPTRSFDLEGLIVNVPSNYDPVARTYAGTWDGTFKQAYTNNPAWVFYDLILNNRYGLGQWVNATMLDRYGLYNIAQYCDVMVSNGAGSQEPRFTCNCYIQSRTDAIKVVQDLASIFRGMAYWGAGAVVATADMPSDPVYVYAAANVVGGQFKYVGSALKNRYTAVAVTWNDPDNNYEQAIEYVENAAGIARYGLTEAQITSFGCTSRGQAQRAGQWLLLTSQYETNTVTFSVGLDGTLCMPGQIIAVADANRAGKRIAGRLNAVVNTSQVTLDKAMDGVAVGDILTVIMPDGVAAQSTVSGIDSTGVQITVAPAFATEPVAGAVWMVESATLESQLFRVVSVAEKDGVTFDISATQYEPAKYAAIDDGAAFTPRPTVGNSFTTQVPPASVACSQYVVTDQGIAKTNLTISWPAAANAVSYTAQWQKDSGAWVAAGTTGQTSIDVANIYSGNYTARVSATNGMGITSVYTYSSLTALTGKTGAPPLVATFTASTDQVFAVALNWTFPTGAGDTAYTEVYYSHTDDFTTAVELGQYGYPTDSTAILGLVAGYDLYFWARLVDTSGNIGAWYPDSSQPGVHGMSSMDATAILTYLTGQITSTQLAQSLAEPVAAIPSIQSSVAANAQAISSQASQISANATAISQEVSDRAAAITAEATARAAAIAADAAAWGTAITTEQTARQAGDSALSQQITTLTATVNGNASAIQTEQTARANGDAANAAQISAISAQINVPTAGDTTGYAGATTVYAGLWSEQSARAEGDFTLAQRIDTVTAQALNGNAQLNASIQTETSARIAADSAQAQQITTLTAQYGSNSAAIQNEATTRATADAALSSQISTVQAQANGNTSAIQNEATARASGDSALSSQISSLSAQINVPVAGDPGSYAGSTTYYAGLWSEQSARAEADLTLSQRIDTVTASATNSTATLFAAVQTETSARIAGDAATASQITTVQAQVNNNLAAIQNEATARADGDTALSQQISTLQSQVGSNSAAIQNEATARAAGDSANATQISTLQSQVGSNTAAIQTNANAYATLNGVVSAMYTIKTQVTSNGTTYIAGIGLSSDTSNGSQVLVTADRFAVLETSGGNTFSPFVIQNGQAFINQAFIGNAWITSAMIANASISSAQIQSGAITNAQIASAAINQAQIQAAAIGSAQIQTAAIQTAHIGQAQIDTLLLGANAATSAASFSGGQTISGTYTSSGGQLAVFLSINDINTGTSQMRITFNGVAISVGNGMGYTAMRLMQPAAGAISFGTATSTGVSTCSVVILEFKR